MLRLVRRQSRQDTRTLRAGPRRRQRGRVTGRATVFDRGMEDVGNIVALEHVNVTMPDPRLATLFYVVGMGFTRDPYLSVGDENMWINLGQQQFHLPTRTPQVLRGCPIVLASWYRMIDARSASAGKTPL